MYAVASDTDPLVWELTVDREPGVRRRPGVRVEAATPVGRRDPQLLRVIAGGATLLWGRRNDPWSDHARFIRGALPERTAALPAVTLADQRACAQPPGSRAWWSHWLRYFSDALAASPDAVLQPGTYALAAFASPLRTRAEDFTTPPLADRYGPLEFTRQPSSVDSGRVSMWQKHYAEGIPPALFYDWVCAPGPLLVDGHDRLLAMAISGAPQLALRLTPTAVGGESRRLVGGTSFWGTQADRRYPFGRVCPMPGGAAQWHREARDRCWLKREEIQPLHTERLLDGILRR